MATSEPWRTLTSMARFSGLFLITLAITYLLAVVSARVDRRAWLAGSTRSAPTLQPS